MSLLSFLQNRRPISRRRSSRKVSARLSVLSGGAAGTALALMMAGTGTAGEAIAAGGKGPESASSPAAKISNFHKGGGLTMRLVSDVTAVRPGGTFHLGLWIQHEPGYHTYWSNPGIAGVATQLKPELPEGFTAGALIYPPPDKVRMSILSVHGYERDVLIALPVTAPREITEPSVTIPVKATWMCCRTTCNPGFASLALTLPIAADTAASAGSSAASAPAEFPAAPASTSASEWKPFFDVLEASQPPPATGWTFTARKNSGITPETIELTATPPTGLPVPEKPQFFSSDNLICSHPAQNWKTGTDGVLTVTLSLSDFPPKDQTHLRGLLHNTGKKSLLPGATTASYVTLDVPVQQTEAAK